MRRLLFWGMLAIFVLLLLAPFASPWPDGLERVAEDQHFAGRSLPSPVPSLFPDYQLPGLPPFLATVFAGGIGVVTVLFLTMAWGALGRRTRP